MLLDIGSRRASVAQDARTSHSDTARGVPVSPLMGERVHDGIYDAERHSSVLPMHRVRFLDHRLELERQFADLRRS